MRLSCAGRASVNRSAKGIARQRVIASPWFDYRERVDCQGIAPAQSGGAPMNDIIFESTISCPHCAFAKQETMPDDG